MRASCKWFDHQYEYRVIPNSYPGGAANPYSRARYTSRIVDGQRTWNSSLNRCHRNPAYSFRAVKEAEEGGASAANHDDPYNTVDFAGGTPLNCKKGMIACTHREQACCWFEGFEPMRNVDIRFSTDVLWYNGTGSGNSGAYDLWAGMAHEAGHALGLSHHPSPNSVMYRTLRKGGAGKAARRLSLADMVGLQRIYGKSRKF